MPPPPQQSLCCIYYYYYEPAFSHTLVASPPVRVLNVDGCERGPTPTRVRARTRTLYAVLGTRLNTLKGAWLTVLDMDTPISMFLINTIYLVITPFCWSTGGGSHDIVADGDTRSVVTKA